MATQPPTAEAAVRTEFDEAYYRRFYGDPATRVSDARTQKRRAAFVFAYLDYVDISVKRVLDLGCGLGGWRREIAARHPRASYTGVDASDYLCDKHGWDRGTAADYRGRGQYDLVICQDVLQYADDAEALRSFENIARLCRRAAYLAIATKQDWEENCDRNTSDGDIYLRTGGWYRRAIGKHFRSLGGGLFLPNDSPSVLFELERLGARDR